MVSIQSTGMRFQSAQRVPVCGLHTLQQRRYCTTPVQLSSTTWVRVYVGWSTCAAPSTTTPRARLNALTAHSGRVRDGFRPGGAVAGAWSGCPHSDVIIRFRISDFDLHCFGVRRSRDSHSVRDDGTRFGVCSRYRTYDLAVYTLSGLRR